MFFVVDQHQVFRVILQMHKDRQLSFQNNISFSRCLTITPTRCRNDFHSFREVRTTKVMASIACTLVEFHLNPRIIYSFSKLANIWLNQLFTCWFYLILFYIIWDIILWIQYLLHILINKIFVSYLMFTNLSYENILFKSIKRIIYMNSVFEV